MDIKLIKGLIALMVENDLSRVELREGDTHILLRRGHPVLAAQAGGPLMPYGNMVAVAPSNSPANVNSPPAPANPAPAASAPVTVDAIFVKSPMVGTFYAAPAPDAPPFVGVGDIVGPETVVCVVEAMKVFNEIKAETRGRVAEVLVRNAQAVEFDQPLFKLAPV